MKLRALLIGYIIAALVFLPIPVWATAYYACQDSQNINGDSTWCTAAHRTGSCAGDGTYTAWATITTSDILNANGCTVIIPNTASTKYDVSKISNKTDGTGTDGGQFTYATAATYTPEVAADIETGGTTGACLAISGTSGAGLKVGFTETITITAGSAAAMYGMVNSATGEGNTVYIGASDHIATVTAGSNLTAHGVMCNGSTGTTVIYSNATGVSGSGIVASGGTVTQNGSCIGSNSAYTGYGCQGPSSTVLFTIAGKDISGTHSTGISGRHLYTPGATDYVLRPKDASYTRGTVDSHAVELPTDPLVENVLLGVTYGSFTGTLSGGSSPYAY